MRRTGLWQICALGSILALTSCDYGIRGNGHVVDDQRAVTDFTEVFASGGLRLQWQPGASGITIRTDENLLRHIDVTVEGSELHIRTHDNLRPTHHITVILSSAALRGASLRGAVDLTAHNLSGPKFYVRASGAADLKLAGTVDEFLVDLTGASDVKARDLHTKITQIAARGASSAQVSVSDTLRVSITGAGSVGYYGTPKTVEKNVTGAGSITHKD